MGWCKIVVFSIPVFESSKSDGSNLSQFSVASVGCDRLNNQTPSANFWIISTSDDTVFVAQVDGISFGIVVKRITEQGGFLVDNLRLISQKYVFPCLTHLFKLSSSAKFTFDLLITKYGWSR
ncbi:hypothetical protein RUM43_015125 [Polyplax serrata]|uniref:Uncharacterized protein n=1 Tax=Polyplax serrata TaxID=468196 RepID=A0AAN8NHR2_POLSC